MLNLPDNGYTPDNYKALVRHTRLSNAAYCRQFEIPQQTFYKHAKGSRSMHWQDWQTLLSTVTAWLDNQD